MKIVKVNPAGWKMETEDETFYFGEYGKFGCYCNEGVVYKDEEAFKTGNGVCYINEYGFDNPDENSTSLFELLQEGTEKSEIISVMRGVTVFICSSPRVVGQYD